MYDFAESLYVGKSDKFFTGILGGGIAKTIMTGGESAVILGYVDNGTGKHQSNTVYSTNGLSPALTTIEGGGTQQVKIMEEVRCQCLGQMDNSDGTFESANRVYDINGISPALNTCGGGGLETKILEQRPISTNGDMLEVANTLLAGYERTNMTGFNNDNAVLLIKNNTKQGYDIAEPGDGIDISGRMEYHRGNVQKGMIETIKCSPDIGVVCNDYRIRKLTPRESFRLMGVKDEDYDKLTVSNSQKYKQAGNSIVVDVLMAIFDNMFIKDCKSNKLF